MIFYKLAMMMTLRFVEFFRPSYYQYFLKIVQEHFVFRFCFVCCLRQVPTLNTLYVLPIVTYCIQHFRMVCFIKIIIIVDLHNFIVDQWGRVVTICECCLSDVHLLQLYWHCDRPQCIFRHSDLTVHMLKKKLTDNLCWYRMRGIENDSHRKIYIIVQYIF